MANINISELAGSALFSDSETYMDSMRELSKDELKISGGGKTGEFLAGVVVGDLLDDDFFGDFSDNDIDIDIDID